MNDVFAAAPVAASAAAAAIALRVTLAAMLPLLLLTSCVSMLFVSRL